MRSLFSNNSLTDDTKLELSKDCSNTVGITEDIPGMTLNSPASSEIDANVLATSDALDEEISCCIAVEVFVDVEVEAAESTVEGAIVGAVADAGTAAAGADAVLEPMGVKEEAVNTFDPDNALATTGIINPAAVILEVFGDDTALVNAKIVALLSSVVSK